MNERTGLVTFKGNGLTLAGNEVKVGDTAPDFTVLANDLAPKTLADYAGKKIVLVVVPSLDTPVCDLQARRFNQEAASLGDDVAVLTISVDLPFAQARWCGAAGADNIQSLSDHAETSFGLAYGLVLKELRLLARAVIVIDTKGKVAYFELVKEVAEEPDYEAAVAAIKAAE